MPTKVALNWVNQNRKRLEKLSKTIWEYAEVGFCEYRSAELLALELEKEGFKTERGVAGMPTAFVATCGSARPVIGILGEYDALPGLSQKVSADKEPVKPGGAGHGCGHNLLGVGSLGGILAAKEAMIKAGIRGTIKYFGCPAEEILMGKVFMAREGLFNGLDAALTWHPMGVNSTWLSNSLALNSVKFNFHGISAHAAAAPAQGRSALDAVILMDIGVNYLREHILPEARIHSVIAKSGVEPNIVPAESQIWYFIRAPRRKEVEEIYRRILGIARGAALMTETTFDPDFIVGCYDFAPNEVLTELLENCLKKVGRPKFTIEARELASSLEATFAAGAKESVLQANHIPVELSRFTLHEKCIKGGIGKGKVLPISTEVGDVSHIVPTAQFNICCQPVGTAAHSWQVTAASGSGIGYQGMLAASKVLALASLELLTKPLILKDAKKEFKEKIKREGLYKSPLPSDSKPSLGLLKPEEINLENR